ncbi:tetratricopeptide repeat protein [Chloroflexi bacterium TSY]|nr:tetratricopeptide repeat protein [Chloroflexi bacterium TSY]
MNHPAETTQPTVGLSTEPLNISKFKVPHFRIGGVSRGVVHNLPSHPTPFIGRTEERLQLLDTLQDLACRLITLAGPGGIGKTRLAIQLAQDIANASPDAVTFLNGIHFVALAPINSPDLLVPTIADALNFTFYDDVDRRVQLLDYLREKKLLLVLDNFEHLLDGADLITDMLAAAPGLKMLVTSREALNVQSEWFQPVNNLDFPKDEVVEIDDLEAELTNYSAVQLFVQCARRVRPDFSLETQQQSVLRICHLVGGMPLGIELATAWLKSLPCERVCQEIERNLDFLTTTMRDLPERHRSMRAVFVSSWQLLSEVEQDILKQLTIFRSGFRAEAAEQVVIPHNGLPIQLTVLASLVEKSLVNLTSEGRYELHELLRQFAAEKLAEGLQEQDATQDRHCEYFTTFLQEREKTIIGNQQKTILDEIKAELENVRAAWSWAVEQGQVDKIDRALKSLYQFYWIRSRFHEGAEAFNHAVSCLQTLTPDPKSEAILAKLLGRQGAFCSTLSRYEQAKELLQRSLDLADRLELQSDSVFALNYLGDIARDQNEFTKAIKLYQQSLSISTTCGHQAGAAYARYGLGWVPAHLGNYRDAKQNLQESLALYRALGHQDGMAYTLDRLGVVLWQMGRYQEAAQHCRESLTIFKEIGNRFGIAKALSDLGLIAHGFGGEKLTEAKLLLEESLAICRETGYQFEVMIQLQLLGRVANDMEMYQESQQYSQEALAISKKIGAENTAIEVLNNLGDAARGLGDYLSAQKYLLEALKFGDNESNWKKIETLVRWASLLISESDPVAIGDAADNKEAFINDHRKRAVELLTLVMNHPSTEQIHKDRANHLLTALTTKLPSAIVTAAQERGKAKSLGEVVAEIVAEHESTQRPSVNQHDAPSAANNLPIQPTTFIGRERELAEIKQLVLNESDCRLLTLIGPGGAGKTRLALETAATVLSVFPHGVYFAPLAPVNEVEFIVSTIAEAIDLTFRGETEPKAQLLNHLRDKSLLLVVDNFEHLLDGVDLLAEMLSEAPHAKLLVTSRERLNLQEEWGYEVQGMAFPSSQIEQFDTSELESLENYSALQLFLQRARRAKSGFILTEEERPSLVRICQMVDGMPLGLELAASWITLMSCREIAAEIEQSLDFLTSSMRNVPERHRSLRAVFEHSWRLLTNDQKAVCLSRWVHPPRC